MSWEKQFEDNLSRIGSSKSSGKDSQLGAEIFNTIGTDADDSITIRLNSVLKKEFTNVCKRNQSTVSRELKMFMARVVKSQSLD